MLCKCSLEKARLQSTTQSAPVPRSSCRYAPRSFPNLYRISRWLPQSGRAPRRSISPARQAVLRQSGRGKLSLCQADYIVLCALRAGCCSLKLRKGLSLRGSPSAWLSCTLSFDDGPLPYRFNLVLTACGPSVPHCKQSRVYFMSFASVTRGVRARLAFRQVSAGSLASQPLSSPTRSPRF